MSHYSELREKTAKAAKEFTRKDWEEERILGTCAPSQQTVVDEEWGNFARSTYETVDEYHPVHKPVGYNSHPSGIQCIEITEHMNFCVGSAIKYLFRHGIKDPNTAIQDLEKARWYIEREITRLKKEKE